MTNIPQVIHESWHLYLEPLFNDSKMLLLKNQILPAEDFYPAAQDIFKVFRMPIDKIRVIILGQDPYPSGEANGLAFSVNSNTPAPLSLKVIYNEVEAQGELQSTMSLHEFKTLHHWEEQGVFLLNSALTVKKGMPGTHQSIWIPFISKVIQLIANHHKCVWLFWGSKAKGFMDYIPSQTVHVINKKSFEEDLPMDKHHILTAYHPASSTHSQSKYSFENNGNFRNVNAIFSRLNQPLINW